MKIEVEQSHQEPKTYFIDDKWREMILMVLAHFQLSEEPFVTIKEVLSKRV